MTICIPHLLESIYFTAIDVIPEGNLSASATCEILLRRMMDAALEYLLLMIQLPYA